VKERSWLVPVISVPLLVLAVAGATWGARSLLVAGGGEGEVSPPTAVTGAGSVEGEAKV